MRVKQALARWWAAGMGMLLAGVLLSTLAPPAQAQSCYVNGAFGMNFGSVTTSGRAATSSLGYTCAPDYSGSQRTFYYEICIYIGPGGWSSGQPTRRMSNYNGFYLNYDLFADPPHTQLIGGPGSTPVYRVLLAVPPAVPQSAHTPIYGWVYPGQSVPAFAGFEEQGLQGLLRYRYSSTGFPDSADCASGGEGGASTSFDSSGVRASFENACRVTVSDMNFGLVDPPQNPLHETASIRIQCAPGTPWLVGLDNGQHFDGVTRRMAGHNGFVKYQLYLDEGRTKIWSDAGTSMAGGVTDGSGNTPLLTVYGRVPAQPDVEGGSYSDTIVLTLHY